MDDGMLYDIETQRLTSRSFTQDFHSNFYHS